MPQTTDQAASAPNAQQRVPLLLAHYDRALPYLLAAFEGTPLVSAFYPHGLEDRAHFVGELHKPLPIKIPTLRVHSATGTNSYDALTQKSLEWLIRERHALAGRGYLASAARTFSSAPAFQGERRNPCRILTQCLSGSLNAHSRRNKVNF